MINTMTQSCKTNFGQNKATAVRRVGKFFEQQVKVGMVQEFKPSFVDNIVIRQTRSSNPNYSMAVTGYSGSGKTFFSDRVREELGDRVATLTGDSFYYDLSSEFAKERKTPDGRTVKGFEGMVYGGYCFEGPHNFDTVRGAQKVEALINGESVLLDKYLMDNTGRVAKDAVLVKPAPLILLDGVCAIFKPLREKFDAVSFWNTPYPTIEQRYFHRGRSPFDEKLLANSQEGGHKYIDPELPNMDIVFNGEAAVEKMKDFARGFAGLLK